MKNKNEDENLDSLLCCSWLLTYLLIFSSFLRCSRPFPSFHFPLSSSTWLAPPPLTPASFPHPSVTVSRRSVRYAPPPLPPHYDAFPILLETPLYIM